jgi:MinD-like ATPase involved in chromosome partitioning or flagellar assembly
VPEPEPQPVPPLIDDDPFNAPVPTAPLAGDPDLHDVAVNPEGFQPLAPNPEAPAVPPAPAPAPIAAPAPMADESYVPAYEDEALGGEPAAPAPAAVAPNGDPLDGFQPQDLLISISNVDPEAESQTQAAQSVTAMRQEAVLSDPGAGKKAGKRQRIRMEPLPFEMLVRGTPLIGTVYSPSGGVGKSSTAMNMAVYIAAIADTMTKKKRERGDDKVRTPRVLVLDGDIAQGSLALRLKGELTPSIHTLQLYIDERESEGFTNERAWPQVYEDAPPGEKAMRDFVMWHEILPNLNLLAAPEEPDLFYDFGPAEFRNILRMLGRFYDVIIIDAGTDVILESQRAWLAHANEVFIITSPEIDRVYNASKAARYIAKSRPHPQDPDGRKLPPLATREKLSVVMTRYDADSGLDPEGVIEELFPWLEDHQKFFIPDVSADMLRANNQGKFLVLKNAQYAKVIGELAKHLFARYAATRQQRALGAATVPPQQ